MVGKSNILTKLCDDIFTQEHVITIGIDYRRKLFDLEGKKLKLSIWDTAGNLSKKG